MLISSDNVPIKPIANLSIVDSSHLSVLIKIFNFVPMCMLFSYIGSPGGNTMKKYVHISNAFCLNTPNLSNALG